MRAFLYVAIVSAVFLPDVVQAAEPTVIVNSQHNLDWTKTACSLGLAPRTLEINRRCRKGSLNASFMKQLLRGGRLDWAGILSPKLSTSWPSILSVRVCTFIVRTTPITTARTTSLKTSMN